MKQEMKDKIIPIIIFIIVITITITIIQVVGVGIDYLRKHLNLDTPTTQQAEYIKKLNSFCNMKGKYYCGLNIDTDFNAEHFDCADNFTCIEEEIDEETN